MMTSIEYIYILQKKYIKDYQILHVRKPICGSENREIIVDRAKRERDCILKYNDPWFNDVNIKQEPLVAWDGVDYFTVGTSDGRLQITFTISIMPLLLNDISE